MELLVVVVAAAVITFVCYGVWRRNERLRNSRAAETSAGDDAAIAELTRLPSLSQLAPALVSEPDQTRLSAINVSVRDLLRQFDSLATFQDVALWDAKATDAARQSREEGQSLAVFVQEAERVMADYRANNREPDIAHLRLANTASLVRRLSQIVADAFAAYDGLQERIELTPDNKKDQRAVLRELRAQKKELQARKREVRAAAAAIRREARVASANAGVTDFLGLAIYSPGVAANERRAIRRQKEAMLQPNEDAIAALDRQIAAVERRITWVQRFGDDGD